MAIPEAAAAELNREEISPIYGWPSSPKVKLDMLGAQPPLSEVARIEKMLRDARASMIEDGCNELLAIKGGTYLIDDKLI